MEVRMEADGPLIDSPHNLIDNFAQQTKIKQSQHKWCFPQVSPQVSPELSNRPTRLAFHQFDADRAIQCRGQSLERVDRHVGARTVEQSRQIATLHAC